MRGASVWCWLLLAHAASAQFLDFPDLSSFFPAVRSQRPLFSFQEQVTKRTTARPENSHDDQHQRKATRKPITQTTKRPTQLKRTTTKKPDNLSFASFVDVPDKDGTKLLYQSSEAGRSGQSSSSSSGHKTRDNGHNSRSQVRTSTESPNTNNNNNEFFPNSRQSSNESPEVHKSLSSHDYLTTRKPNYSQESGRYTTRKVTTTRTTSRSDDYNYYSGNTYESSTRRPSINDGNQDVIDGNITQYGGSYFTTNQPISRYDYTTKSTTHYYDFTTKRPSIFEYDNKFDSDRRGDAARDRPSASRPGSGTLGVLTPNIDESREPITNRPPSRGGGEQDGFVFREEEAAPELITGPDEHFLSEDKKRRALQAADRMCARYQAQNTEQLSAIPLVPSPSPATVSVRRCTPINVPLVVGGQVVTIDQYPHMAAVGWTNLRGGGYSWKCGGSLVSEQFVLTAAHCSHQDRDNTIAQGPPRAVQLGATRLDDPAATIAAVAAAIRHPKYKSPAAYYDIALLKLRTTVSLSDKIRPACIGEAPRVGESVIATGWGQTEFGGSTSAELRGVSLPVWELATCARALGTSRKLPRGPDLSQLCAGELRGGKDTCQGDSGGPAQVGSSCEWRVVGVTSLGRACGAPRTPALYARAQRLFIAAVVWL